MSGWLVRRSVGEWAAQWDALVDADRPSPFLRSVWLDAVADDSTRLVLVVDDDGRLLGGFPFQLSAHRRRTVTASGGQLAPDHLDLVCAPEHADEVGVGVLGWLDDEGVRGVDVHGLVEGSRLAGLLAGRLDGVDRRESVAPWARLPTTFDEYWSARPGELRSTVRRTRNRLGRSGIGYERVRPADGAAALRQYVGLHGARFGDTSAVLPARAVFERACRAAIDGHLLVAHRLTDGARAVAVELWFEHGAVASFYQSGRDPDPAWRGAGSVLKADVVRAAIEGGAGEIDLLRGDEPYKRAWADREREVRRVASPPTATDRMRSTSAARLRHLRDRLGGGASRRPAASR